MMSQRGHSTPSGGSQDGTPSRSAVPRLASIWRVGLLVAVKCFATGFLLTCLLIAAIALTDRLPPDPMRMNLLAAFENGTLQEKDYLPGNRQIGFHQYNDCLLVMMVRFRPPSAIKSAVAPVAAWGDYPSDLLNESGELITQCQLARASVYADEPRSLYENERYLPYSRYVHAYRIPFNLMIYVAPASTIREIYRWAGVLSLIGVVAAHIYRTVVATGPKRLEKVTSYIGFAILSGTFLAYFGLDLFGPSFTHGPADLLLFLALAWLSLFARDPHGGAWVLTSAVLGALAFSFEFLHGTLPLMIAIILGAAALRAFAASRELSLADLAVLIGAFGLGTAGSIAAKLTAVFAVEGTEVIHVLSNKLVFYTAGGDPSYFELAGRLFRALDFIGWGSRVPVLLALCIGGCGAVLATVALTTGLLRPALRSAIFASLVSIAIIPIWYAVFLNHSWIHAQFMVRLLAWPIGMGLVCLLLVRAALVSALQPSSRTGCV